MERNVKILLASNPPAAAKEASMDYTARHMSVWDSRRLQPLPKVRTVHGLFAKKTILISRFSSHRFYFKDRSVIGGTQLYQTRTELVCAVTMGGKKERKLVSSKFK